MEIGLRRTARQERHDFPGYSPSDLPPRTASGLGSKTDNPTYRPLGGGERLAVSDLVRMECQVGPLKRNDALLLSKFAVFFASPDVQVLSISAAVCDRAAMIRAHHGVKPLDALHLATAVENGCSLFLTNDNRLGKFPNIPLEVLT